MASAVLKVKASSLLQLKQNPQSHSSFLHSTPQRISFPSSSNIFRSFKSPMAAALTYAPAAGLAETFSRLKQQGKVALIPYITAGDPDLSTTAEALKLLDRCGSDIIELGLPFSDPLDGPVLQAAATRSLAGGTNFDKIMSMLKDVVPQLSAPIALFSYYNPIHKLGVEKFMITVKHAGVHGLLIPEVPLEDIETLRKEAVKNELELVLLTGPTTPTARMKAIVEAAEGFVYVANSVGATGVRASENGKLRSTLKDIKEVTSKPVAVGFGISKPEHVKEVVECGADGVIVGSAMVKVLADTKSPEEGLKELETFTKSLKSALL